MSNVPLPEDGHSQKGEQLHLRAAPSHQRYKQTAKGKLGCNGPALFHRGAGGGKPEPQPQHQQRRTAEDGVLINVGTHQQVIQLAAQHHSGHGQQVRGRCGLREPPAHGLPHHAEAGGEEQQPQNDHAGRIGQILDAGQRLKGQLEQQARHNAKIDVVAPIVEGVIPVDIVDLRRIPCPGIVGVLQRQQLGGRVGLQIQAAIQQAVGQCAVLLVDEADGALTVPECGVVIFCSKAGVARLPEGHNHHKGGQNQTQHGSCGAVAYIARQPAAVP